MCSKDTKEDSHSSPWFNCRIWLTIQNVLPWDTWQATSLYLHRMDFQTVCETAPKGLCYSSFKADGNEW